MSEQTISPLPEEPREPVATLTQTSWHDRLPVLCGVGFVILAAAIIFVWQNPTTPHETEANTQALQTVQQHLTEIDARLTRLEQRPVVDIGKVNAQLDALGHQADSLDHKLADQGQLAGRLDTASAKIDAVSSRDQTAIDAAKQQLDALAGRVSALETSAGNVQAVNTRLARLAKLQEASFGLAFGRPVGDLPGAPGPLARYAHVAPPTQAQLMLRFRDASQAALSVPPPEETSPSFVERALDRAEGLITIRRGKDLVVGNPVAITLNKAQTALDAGDLGGAVAAVETLKGPPAEAMANWLEDAKGLLEARAALDQMASQA